MNPDLMSILQSIAELFSASQIYSCFSHLICDDLRLNKFFTFSNKFENIHMKLKSPSA